MFLFHTQHAGPIISHFPTFIWIPYPPRWPCQGSEETTYQPPLTAVRRSRDQKQVVCTQGIRCTPESDFPTWKVSKQVGDLHPRSWLQSHEICVDKRAWPASITIKPRPALDCRRPAPYLTNANTQLKATCPGVSGTRNTSNPVSTKRLTHSNTWCKRRQMNRRCTAWNSKRMTLATVKTCELNAPVPAPALVTNNH